MDDLIHTILIAFKDSLYGAVPAIFNPTSHPKSGSRFLSVVAEEDALNSSFDDDACPYLFFHLNLSGMVPQDLPLRRGHRAHDRGNHLNRKPI